MTACSAIGCTNRSWQGKKEGFSFHTFPKNPEQRKRWIAAVKRKNWAPSKCSVLCSKHFSEDQIDRFSASKVRLKENAVPNIFPAFPSYFQKEIKSRKPPLKRSSFPVIKNTASGQTSDPADFNTDQEENENIQIISTAVESNSQHDACSTLSTSPQRTLKRQLENAESSIKKYRKQIHSLQQSNRRMKKKLLDLCNNKSLENENDFWSDDSKCNKFICGRSNNVYKKNGDVSSRN